MSKLYLLLEDDDIGDYIGWGWYEDTEEGWEHIHHVVKYGVGYKVIRGECIKTVPSTPKELQ